MKRLILHLGGGYKDRSNKAMSLQKLHPQAPILVSSENPRVVPYYRSYGVSVTHDVAAWDTVTNFTHTFKRIKREYNPEEVLVVTHDFHMNRAMRIAHAVYWGTGITPIACPVASRGKKKESDLLVWQDTIRAWIWRLTGILFYWKKIRQQRKGSSEPTNWREIGL